ncbi:MAG: hypothetical protein NC344_02820 [Bacteroidales bacterium]|nr:hypothetical protein [Bacteroidales bacterium]MCM1146764.1 hypothetical protein [Bacteroidales bacterium]MCM1205739.1 hypothetical protein [Bacillota bacterium]MCM1510731.1 hypothetical protein [Clostridium sp.]
MAMSKDELLELLGRMCAPHEPDVCRSWEMTSWKALREAEKLTDRALFPILEEIIHENPGESGLDIRKEAYFIYKNLLMQQFNEERFAFLLSRLDMEVAKGEYMWWHDFLHEMEVNPDIPVTPLLAIAERGNKYDVEWVCNDIETYAKRGNVESIIALPALKAHVKTAKRTQRQATADILKEHGVESKADIERLSEEDGAELYEALKAGVLEEYDITPKRLERLVEQILK